MEPIVCSGCRSEVWPEYEDQPHRNCDNCGTRVWFKESARKRFGSDSIPRHALPEFPSNQRGGNDHDDSTTDEPTNTSLDDYL